ncbi:MAG: hypothetical protein HY040_02355 [Planctomycetes bacterium]|nr:hypothetical protein [Planctomycetota bacterium]
MKALFSSLTVIALVFVLYTGIEAGDKDKEVTLKGKITCAKCDLGVETKCATVIVAKKDGKDVTFYFDAAAGKKHHSTICNEAKQGSVTGVVGGDDKKRTITVKSVKFE